MYFIFLSIIFSVVVSVVLKVSSRQAKLDLKQMIAFNYISAILLCFFILKPSLPNHWSQLTWPLFITLGILLPSIFIVMGLAIKNIGLIKTDIAQRLALFIPIIASFTIFNESVSIVKIIGILLAFLAIILLMKQKNNQVTSHAQYNHQFNFIYFLSILIGFGIIDILFKQIAKSGTEFSLTLLGTFILAAIIIFAILLFNKSTLTLHNIIIGLILGLFNFANIYFYIRSHQYYSKNPTLVFTAINIGVIILGTILGKIVFKEPLNARNWIGVFLAIFSIIILFNGEKLI